MKIIYTLGFILGLLISISAQDSSFTANVNAKQVESGKVIRIDFSIKNLKGDFEAPDFSPFKIVGGPNQSSSFQMINGEVTREFSYSYFLQAPEAGIYVIPQANLFTDEKVHQTEPLEIIVLGEGEQPLPKPDRQPADSSNKLKEILKGKKTKRLK